MLTETNIRLHPGELAQVVESVFRTMLTLEVTQSQAPWFPSEERLTAAVHLAGDWSGVVLLECDRWQACQFAGRFLSGDPPEKVDNVERDLLGELVNMIGGNLKCALGRGLRGFRCPRLWMGATTRCESAGRRFWSGSPSNPSRGPLGQRFSIRAPEPDSADRSVTVAVRKFRRLYRDGLFKPPASCDIFPPDQSTRRRESAWRYSRPCRRRGSVPDRPSWHAPSSQ